MPAEAIFWIGLESLVAILYLGVFFVAHKFNTNVALTEDDLNG
jgi:hypothetical protein